MEPPWLTTEWTLDSRLMNTSSPIVSDLKKLYRPHVSADSPPVRTTTRFS